MRTKEDFTIYPRKMKNGKIVFYYRTYDEFGNRSNGMSTGQTSKGAARKYCTSLLKEGKLLPITDPTLQQFSKDFFVYTKCPYINGILKRGGHYSENNALIQRGNLKKHILPTFGKLKLKDISPKLIEKWLYSFRDKGLSNVTANNNLKSFRLILNEAERLQYIDHNPINRVKPLHDDSRPKSILNKDEVKELLRIDNFNLYWKDYYAFTACFLAAETGMRMGEVQALKFEDIHYDCSRVSYIKLVHSWEKRFHKLKKPKNGKSRTVPVSCSFGNRIEYIKQSHSQGFVFSLDNGITPICDTVIRRHFYDALNMMGISEEERKKRNISFHSWRYFANSRFRTSGLPDVIVREIIGHSSEKMSDHYTNISDYEIMDAHLHIRHNMSLCR